MRRITTRGTFALLKACKVCASNPPYGLNQIATDPDDLQDMRNAVAAGLRVTTAQSDITVDNFTGLGYILEDPKTGAAAYMISGGRNGSNSPAGQTVYPLPQIPASPIFGFILGSSLRSAGAALAAEGGVFTGISLPAVAAEAGTAGGEAGSVGGPILAALIVSLVQQPVISTNSINKS